MEDLENHSTKCRCCLSFLDHGTHHPEFTQTQANNFKLLTQIELRISPIYSNKFCTSCEMELERFVKFRADAIQRQKRLYDYEDGISKSMIDFVSVKQEFSESRIEGDFETEFLGDFVDEDDFNNINVTSERTDVLTTQKGLEIMENLNRQVNELTNNLHNNFPADTPGPKLHKTLETALPFLKFITELGSVTATLTKQAIASRNENLRLDRKLNHFITNSSSTPPARSVRHNELKFRINSDRNKAKRKEKAEEDYFGDFVDSDETIPMTRPRQIMSNPPGADIVKATRVIRQFKKRTGIIRTVTSAKIFAEEVRLGGEELAESMAVYYRTLTPHPNVTYNYGVMKSILLEHFDEEFLSDKTKCQTIGTGGRHTTNDSIFRFCRHAAEYMEILLRTCGNNWSKIFVERALNGVRVGLQKIKGKMESVGSDSDDNSDAESNRIETHPLTTSAAEIEVKKRKSDRSAREKDMYGECKKKKI